MSAELQMVFSRDKSHRTVTIDSPGTNLTKPQVEAVMNKLVGYNVILANKLPVNGIKSAYLSEVTVTELPAA